MNFSNGNKKLFLTLMTLLCIVLGLVSFNRLSPTAFESTIGRVLVPMQNKLVDAYNWVSTKFMTSSEIEKLIIKANELSLEVELKDIEIQRLSQLELENAKLLELLSTSSKYGKHTMITADVVAKDAGNWYEMFTINKGYLDGLSKDMVVLASGGLVGKLEEVGPNYAIVSSIINGTYSVSSKTLRTDDEGFITGDLYNIGTYKMEYIDIDAEIKEGDEIITSHLSSIYPAGITIGFVQDVFLDEANKISKTAIVNPIIDFKHLERVLVITDS